MSSLILFLCTVCISHISAVEIELKPVTDSANYKVFDYKLTNTLKCNASAPLTADLAIKWKKNDIMVEPSEGKLDIKPNGQLVIHRTVEDDMGIYACVLENTTSKQHIKSAEIIAIGKPTAKILQKMPQGAFIEGQKISLECIAQGNPAPKMEWRFGNETFPSDTTSTKSDRIKVSQGSPFVLNLQIDEADMSDRGEYICRVWNQASDILNLTIETSMFVRVKDKLAALWPFIGICAEVIVLCAIILVYERNRMKSELEESDTDISPEQKNTPDHGKEAVRQRK
ncbi:basigin [Cimex lectularius]|uniref:Ig-like domain-containing protein n=1 Tax=Cimex lectularius TaxID=79782 RepID=A0A8I6RQ14_CIMLE|nr:basigin [Cimex lectularius]